MSWEALSWAKKQKGLGTTAKLLLILLAEKADSDYACWPSIARLADEMECSDRTVQRLLDKLEGEKIVTRQRRRKNNEWITNRYTLAILDASIPPPDDVGDQRVEGETRSSSPPSGVKMSPGGGGDTAMSSEVVTPECHQVVTPECHTNPTEHQQDPTSLFSVTAEPKPKRRPCRIPDDFEVSPELKMWARQHVPAVDLQYETSKFVDYWRGRSGQAATKLDWDGTWRNWMRKAQENIQRTPVRARQSQMAAASNNFRRWEM